MITVDELHIAFKEGFNHISSFQGEELLDDEIDRYLSRAQVALVTQLYDRYTQHNQFSTELSQLEAVHATQKVYYPSNTEQIYISKSGFEFGYFIPPTDYMYTLNTKAKLKSGKICDTSYVETTGTGTEYIAVLPFDTELIGSNTDLDFIVTNDISGTPIELLNLSSYNLPTIESEEDKFYYIETVLTLLNARNSMELTGQVIANDPANLYKSQDIKVYWERYRELYYPNYFIFVSGTDYSSQFLEIKIDSSSATSYDATNTNRTYYVIAGEKTRNQWYAKTFQTKDSTGGSVNDTFICREVDKTKAFELLDNPMDKPTRERPHTTHRGNYIWVHTPSRTTVQEVYLDYIKYPRMISKRLQWHSQLSKHLAQDIVNYAVQFAMTEVGDAKIQVKTQIDKLDT